MERTDREKPTYFALLLSYERAQKAHRLLAELFGTVLLNLSAPVPVLVYIYLTLPSHTNFVFEQITDYFDGLFSL